jgi:anti-sigma regulatory factor (Ser/Thr protein kinase)
MNIIAVYRRPGEGADRPGSYIRASAKSLPRLAAPNGTSPVRTVEAWRPAVITHGGWLAQQEPPAVPTLRPLPASRQEGGQARAWPLWDFLELAALTGSVPCARYHARQMLREWGLTGLTETAGLVVSELVTNAVAATWLCDRGLPVRMWLMSDAASVLILVWDVSPHAPLLVCPGDDAEAGRGISIVNAVSASWDWYPVPDTAGKVVRALVTG